MLASRAPLKIQALRLLRERHIPFRSVLDVGVLHGTDELIEVFPDIPHILFEPVSDFAPHIAGRYKDIEHTLVEKAVSDRNGEVLLATSTIIAGLEISHSSMMPDVDPKGVSDVFQDSNSPNGRVVPMTTLDTYLKEDPAESPYFLKIDIDGHELLALRGAEKTLRDTAAAMIEVTTATLCERITFMQKAGFSLFDIVEPCYYDGALWCADAIFIREDYLASGFAHIHNNFNQQKWEIFRG